MDKEVHQRDLSRRREDSSSLSEGHCVAECGQWVRRKEKLEAGDLV